MQSHREPMLCTVLTTDTECQWTLQRFRMHAGLMSRSSSRHQVDWTDGRDHCVLGEGEASMYPEVTAWNSAFMTEDDKEFHSNARASSGKLFNSPK